jgi:predicted nuclease of predicted toxin-antitoxin system
MRFLVDESLSARVARLLEANGHDAVHAADLGLLGAADTRVMHAAASDERVLLAADTDFGELLAIGRHPGPSLVIFRRADHRAEEQVELLLASLADEESLAEGAVVVLTLIGCAYGVSPSRRHPESDVAANVATGIPASPAVAITHGRTPRDAMDQKPPAAHGLLRRHDARRPVGGDR